MDKYNKAGRKTYTGIRDHPGCLVTACFYHPHSDLVGSFLWPIPALSDFLSWYIFSVWLRCSSAVCYLSDAFNPGFSDIISELQTYSLHLTVPMEPRLGAHVGSRPGLCWCPLWHGRFRNSWYIGRFIHRFWFNFKILGTWRNYLGQVNLISFLQIGFKKTFKKYILKEQKTSLCFAHVYLVEEEEGGIFIW